MNTLSALLVLWGGGGGNPLVTGGSSPHKRPIMRYLHVPYFRKPNNNLLNKQSSYWWYKTPRRSTDATVMQDLPYRIHKLTIQYKLGGIYQEMSKLLFYLLLLFYFLIMHIQRFTVYCFYVCTSQTQSFCGIITYIGACRSHKQVIRLCFYYSCLPKLLIISALWDHAVVSHRPPNCTDYYPPKIISRSTAQLLQLEHAYNVWNFSLIWFVISVLLLTPLCHNLSHTCRGNSIEQLYGFSY